MSLLSRSPGLFTRVVRCAPETYARPLAFQRPVLAVQAFHAQPSRPTALQLLTARFYADYPPHIAMQMPALSPTMEKGNLARWSKKVGDRIESGDVIANIETDKSEMSWDVSDEGYLAAVLVEDQTEDIPVGTVVAVICEEEEDVEAFKDYKPEETAAPKKEAPKKEAPKKEAPKKEAPKKEEPKKEDKKPASAPAPKKEASKPTAKKSSPDDQYEDEEDEYTDVPNSNVRKVTAARLSESKQTVPHYYLTIELNADKLLEVRRSLNEKSSEYKISINDFVVKAAALAMKKVPEVNSSWNEKAIRRYKQVHINVAVSSDKGLFTPLVTDTDKKGLKEISSAVKALATKAQDGKLTSEEMKTGTFTISNLGMFGVDNFSAIVNPPQACILAVGGIHQKATLNRGANAAEAPVSASSMMTCTLSCDHRVVDGASGAMWLQEFKARMEDPMTLLL